MSLGVLLLTQPPPCRAGLPFSERDLKLPNREGLGDPYSVLWLLRREKGVDRPRGGTWKELNRQTHDFIRGSAREVFAGRYHDHLGAGSAILERVLGFAPTLLFLGEWLRAVWPRNSRALSLRYSDTREDRHNLAAQRASDIRLLLAACAR
jgi:hypothetical protein